MQKSKALRHGVKEECTKGYRCVWALGVDRKVSGSVGR